MRNKYCRLRDLTNESSVEQFFVARLLLDLGFSDSQVKTKESIEAVTVSMGRRKVKYKPDYTIILKRRPRLVIDAKAPRESLDKWVGQCGSYCLEINRRYDTNPVQFFVLTNGASFRLYEWDREECRLDLSFEDFVDGNSGFGQLKRIVAARALSGSKKGRSAGKGESGAATSAGHFRFTKQSIGGVNSAFAWCHQYIYKKDNISQAAAFMEFVKLMFLKLLSDKEIHKKYPRETDRKQYAVPGGDVQFSLHWIEALEKSTANPMADVAFRSLRAQLEDQVSLGEKKRIFDKTEELALSPETIKGVVERLQGLDLYSIDADLNGRLFETFLNATMRGKDLGQYFTPRSVVKVMVALAGISIGRTADSIPLILDPCCGSGGFLIDALWSMWGQVDSNRSLSGKEKEKLKRAVATRNVVGIDVGKEPPIARIARINMYLHGDGGSQIYQADSLDKSVRIDPPLSAERKKELNELKQLIKAGGLANVILTNPPFSKAYSTKYAPEKSILEEYGISYDSSGGKRLLRASVRSSVLFLERYHDLLAEGGRAVVVVDDSILGGKRYADVREFVRERFIVEGVISLPGDAFQRSKARVKTSVVILRKKMEGESQPSAFMYYCSYVGIDDSSRQRTLPVDRENRKRAEKEIKDVAGLFREFRAGKGRARKWTVPGSRLGNRLDVKSCLPQPGRLVAGWRRAGHKVLKLRDMVDVFDEDNMADADVIYTSDSSEELTFLRARYDGVAEPGERKLAGDTDYPVLYRVHEDDIVLSNINAVHGAICVVPKELDGCVVSSEFTICRAKPPHDPRLVWLLARSPAARADLLLLASGIGRTRVEWENARSLDLALPPKRTAEKVAELIRESEQLARTASAKRAEAERLIRERLNLDNPTARRLIRAFKPPR